LQVKRKAFLAWHMGYSNPDTFAALGAMLNTGAPVSVIEMSRMSRYGQAPMPEHGFTLVELVVTLIIVGILAVVVAPRFQDQSSFDARTFSDKTLAVLRYAQKTAIAQRRTVCVTFSAASVAPATVTLSIAPNFGGACSDSLTGPNGVKPYKITAVDGVSFSALTPNSTTNSFSPLGQAAVGQTIQVSGISNIITIEQETGYVR
jgi:MSHA pilin protein MshC